MTNMTTSERMILGLGYFRRAIKPVLRPKVSPQ